MYKPSTLSIIHPGPSLNASSKKDFSFITVFLFELKVSVLI